MSREASRDEAFSCCTGCRTGIDAHTQVEDGTWPTAEPLHVVHSKLLARQDGELFDFDREVEPILDVLVPGQHGVALVWGS